MTTVLEQIEAAPNVIRFPAKLNLTDDQFFEFCVLNRDWRIERTAEGEIQITSPAGAGASNRNLEVSAQLALWTKKDGTGVAFDSSAGFNLPNRASRSPDASWVRRERLKKLSPAQKEKFLPLCPDFAVELRSPSDRLPDLKRKLEEYIDNGARLGWLINPRPARSLPTGQAVLLKNSMTHGKLTPLRSFRDSCSTWKRSGSRTSERQKAG